VLLYHRVNDFSQDSLTTSLNRFIEHLHFLKRRYPVIALSDAVRLDSTGAYLGPNVVVITFDDGYADNFECAAPILRHFGLPATFFVSAGLVGTADRFAHDGRSPYRFGNLRWDEVRALRDAGFEIGSHGWGHRNLADCTLDDAQKEVVSSRERIQQELGSSVRSFAYPFGGRTDITPAVIDGIRGAGFDVVASAYGGTNIVPLDPNNVVRSGVNDRADALTLHAEIEGISLARLRACFRTPPNTRRTEQVSASPVAVESQ